jgi:glycosyltransferase involved in cell wall biosynthesis
MATQQYDAKPSAESWPTGTVLNARTVEVEDGDHVSAFADGASRDRLRVVVVDGELPYPANSGKRIRTLNLLTRLGRQHQLTFVCHRNSEPEEAKRAAAYLADRGISSVVVDRAVPPKSGPAFVARLGANLFSRLPYSVVTHSSRELWQALRNLADLRQVDLWQCEGTTNAQVLDCVPGPWIVHTQNVESSIWRRYFENERNPLRRWYIKQQWRKFQRFERAALSRAHQVIAVSELDAEAFRNDCGVARIDVVENGVDTAYFRPLADRPRDPRRLLFLGSLDWRPNLDAVNQLLETVFPAIQTCEPAARLVIVGRHPPVELQARLAQRPGVELHANVTDVRPYLAEAGLMVVPLRIGGGSRIKILEALASELPVIATRIGAEGLCLGPGNHLTVVDTIAEIVPAVVQAIRQPVAMADQARRGRHAVVAHYDWDKMAARLERVWAKCRTRSPG